MWTYAQRHVHPGHCMHKCLVPRSLHPDLGRVPTKGESRGNSCCSNRQGDASAYIVATSAMGCPPALLPASKCVCCRVSERHEHGATRCNEHDAGKLCGFTVKSSIVRTIANCVSSFL
eukprot:1159616-Pelagomonas_calceolata.AAC.3